MDKKSDTLQFKQWPCLLALLAVLFCTNIKIHADITITVKPNKTTSAKIDETTPGESTNIILDAISGWKITDVSPLSTGNGISTMISPDPFHRTSSVKYKFTVALDGLKGSIAAKYSGHLVHPGGHGGGGELPDFTAKALSPVYVTVDQVLLSPAHVVGVDSEFTVNINATAHNLQKDATIAWTDFSATIKYSEQKPDDLSDPSKYNDSAIYEWVNELGLHSHDNDSAIAQGTLKLEEAGYYMIIGNATCTVTNPDNSTDSDSSSSDHNPKDEIKDNDSVTVVAITATATPEDSKVAAYSPSCSMAHAYSTTKINISITPEEKTPGEYSQYVTLALGDVTNKNAKPNTGKGILSKNNGIWFYGAFPEPKSVIHPTEKNIAIKVLVNGTDTENSTSISIIPVFEYLTNAPYITESSDGEQYGPAYYYIRCKYYNCLSTTGGDFDNVTFSDSKSLPGGSNAVTTSGGDVTFAINTFLQGENEAASIIGHELYHTAVAPANFPDECGAYDWEINHANCTGISSTEVEDLEQIKQNVYNCP